MTTQEIIRLVGAEFDDVSNEDLAKWIELTEPLVGRKAFGQFYEQALAYLTCHKMKMAGLGENTLGDLGKVANSFAVSSVSDGGSSISFAGNSAASGANDAEYSMTVYGTQYLQLRKSCIITIRSSGEGGLSVGI